MPPRETARVTRPRAKKSAAAAKPKLPKRKTPDTETENLLLGAADALLIERGNLNFSLAEVAERTNLSAALVHYYFGSKHGLLSALLEWSSSKSVGQLNSLMAMDYPALTKLQIHVRALIKTYTKAPYLDRLLHHLVDASDEEEAKRISTFYVMRVVAFYRQLIDQGVREGTMRPVDPMDLYLVLLGTADHFSARRRLVTTALGTDHLDDEFAVRFADVFIDMLTSGVRTGYVQAK
jgi:AcrR family transcriptional regulator